MRTIFQYGLFTLLILVMLSFTGYSQNYLEIIVSPTSVCPGEEVIITNNSVDAPDHEWIWAFCKADPNEPPDGDVEEDITGILKSPVYLSLNYNESNSLYYVFINNYNETGTGNDVPGKITRFEYPDLSNQAENPLDLSLPNGDMPKNLEGLQIVYDEYGTHEWYGFIVGGNSKVGNTSYIARLDFGSSLENESPEITMLYEDPTHVNLEFPHDLYIFYDEDDGKWHGFTVNKEGSSITRFDFNNGLTDVPDIVNLGNPGNELDKPVGIFPIRNEGEWFVFVTDSEKGLFRLDFGADLLNNSPVCNPVAVEPVNSSNDIVHMRDISLFRSCEGVYGYIVAGEVWEEYNLVSLAFDNGITIDPRAVAYGTLNNSIEYGHSISEVFRVENDYYAMVCNHAAKNITRLILPSCSDVNNQPVNSPYPAPVVYSEPGYKTIEVICDLGTAEQENECFYIEVKPLPEFADNLWGNDVVCPGETVNFYVDPVLNADEYHWYPEPGMTVVAGDGTENVDIAIDAAILPGPKTIELVCENECGTGSSVFFEIQVDTSTIINNHPIELQPVEVSADADISVLAHGSNLTYQWQESDNNGVSWNDLPDSYPYVGVTTDHLTILNVQPDMTGYQYRCIVNGSCSPTEVVSGECILVVGALLTTVGEDQAQACPETDINVPVSVVGFSAVNNFNLSINYNDNYLTFTGFDNIHDDLTGLTVDNPSDGLLTISWSTTPGVGVNILQGKMVNLKFHTAVGDACDFSFNESACSYESETSDQLDAEYSTYSFQILPLPETPAMPSGTNDRCEGSEMIQYDIPVPQHTLTYEWTLYPPEAGTITGNSNPADVTWEENFHGDAWLKVKGYNACGEGAFGDSLKIVTKPLPLQAVAPLGDTNLCMAGPSTAYTTLGGEFADSYTWTITPANAGVVSGTGETATVTWDPEFVGLADVMVLSENECGSARQISDPIYVDVNSLPEIIPWVSDTLAYLDAPVSFNADVFSGAEPYSYHWDFMRPDWYSHTADTTIVPDDPYHEYVLTVVDSNNCVMTTKVAVKILLPLFVPNAFTPGGDGVNDRFKGFVTGNVEGVRYRLLVYSREGTMVYEEKGSDLAYMDGWDGTFKGEQCNAGVYVYFLYYEIMGYDGREGEQLLQGTFTLLR